MKRTTLSAGIAALLLSAVLSEVRAVSDQGCGSTKTCVRFPVGCSPTQATCHFFSYSWDESSSSFTMELSGGTGSGSTYMAVGFAPNPTMEKTDMYYCTGTSLKTGVIQGLRQMPITDSVLAASVSEQQASTNSGVAECTFTRQANFSRVVSAAGERINFDLSTESFHVLLASGSVSGGQMQYHGGSRWASSAAYQFTSPPANATSGILSGCNVTKKCYTSQAGCTPGTADCVFVSWKYKAASRTFDIEMSAVTSGYVALAFATLPSMANADLYYCTSGGLKTGVIGQLYSQPEVEATLTNGVQSRKVTSAGGLVTCSFTRPATVTREPNGISTTFDLVTNNFHILTSTGDVLGGTILYHGLKRWASTQSLNYTEGFGDSTTTDGTPTADAFAFKLQNTPNCTPGTANCITLSWNYDASSESFQMQLSGKPSSVPAYVAVAFASTNLMQDADLYYCSGDAFGSGALREQYTDPVFGASLTGVTADKRSATNGVYTCDFTRAASLVKTVGRGENKTFDLATNSYYVLFATGQYFSDNLIYHFETRWVSSQAINFVTGSAAGGITTTTSPAILPPTVGGITSECGLTAECARSSPSCKPESDSSCIVLSWTYLAASGSFDMTVSGKASSSQYIAVGFASSNLMQDVDVYICTESSLLSGAIGSRYSNPVVATLSSAGITSDSASLEDGMLTCSFTRPANVTRAVSSGSKDFDLTTTSFNVLFAKGSTFGGAIYYHDTRSATASQVNFLSGFSTPATPLTSTSLAGPSPAATLPVCGGATRCVTNTADCTPGTATCLQLAWTYDRAAGSFDMVLTGADAGGNSYAAVAFASSGSMQDADLYYCTTSGLGTGSLTEQYTPPVVDAIRPLQVTYSAIDGVMQCRFTRGSIVSRTVGGNVTKNFDLVNENYFILMASSYYFSEIIYHESNRWVVPKTNFTSAESPATTSQPSTTTVSTVSSSTAPPSTPETSSSTTTQAPTSTPSTAGPTPSQPAPSVLVAVTQPASTTHQSLPVTSSPAAPVASFFGCGSTKNCSYYVTNCKSSSVDSCDYVAWSYNAATNSFEFEMSGEGPQGSYVAMALTATGKMERAEMYYCTSSELKSGVIRALQSQPVVDSTLAAGITNVRVQYVDGLIQCTFTRAASVRRQLTARTKRQAADGPTAFDLKTTNYYTLMAKGGSSGGNIQYHFANRNASNSPLSFMPPSVPTTNTTGDNADSSVINAISTTPASSLAPTSTPSLNGSGSGCGETKSCFQFPPGCLQGTADCIFVTWQFDPESKTVQFDISGASSGQYSAFALSPEGVMENSDLYYCTGSSLKSGELRGRHQPPVTNPEPLPVSNAVAEVKDGVLQCSFSRPISVTKQVKGGKFDFDVAKQEFYMLVAGGSLVQGETPVNHGGRKAVSGLKINFTAVSNVKSAPTPSYKQVLVKFHAALMIMAWLTCASIGVLIARHFKPLWHDTTCFGGKVWFQVHRSFMMIAVLATIVAFILIFVSVGGYSSSAGAHPIIGIVVTALAIINPVMAIFRPHPDAPKRPVFNWGHWFVGLCAHTLSVVAIFLGIDLPRLDLDRWLTWLMIAFVVFHIATEVIMEILSAKYGHIAAYKKNNKTNALKLEDRNGDNDDTPPKQTAPKGAGIKFAVLGIYSLVNFAFFLIFIVVIARHA